MMTILHQMFVWIKKQLWSLIVAYMLGLHNFYHGDDKTADNIAITTEAIAEQENGEPKDVPKDS